MKIKIKHVSKQALSVVLAIMMLVSTMLIGTMSVVAADDDGISAQAVGTTIYVAGNFGKTIDKLTVWTGSEDSSATLVPTEYKYNGYTVYKAENVAGGNYTHLTFSDTSRWNNIIDGADSSTKNGQLYYCTDATQGNATWVQNPQWDATGLTTPKLKGASSVLPGGTVTVSIDNQKKFCNTIDDLASGALEGLTFNFTVTDSDGNTVETTPSSSGKLVNADGTDAGINDTISFTASSTEGVTYTIKATVSATGYDSKDSAELTVAVKYIPFAQDGRIYAYAKSLADGETPASDAWVAAENNAAQQDIYHDDDMESGAKNYPTLGSASSNNLRIFLPTSASSTEAYLYNAASGDLVVGSATIKPGEIGKISYVSGTSQNITLGGTAKTLTIYKSSAEGALYLNNTGSCAAISDDGVPSMLTQLYKGKDSGEIADGNSGAISDKDGNVASYAVKKVKGRGNSTWINTDKKSFNVTFTDAIKSLGFTGKKYSLLANYKDASLSRNRILYALADEMGVKYSPDTKVVDLYMNGLYMGSYLMCQKVEVGSKELVNDLGKTLLEDLYADENGKVTDASAIKGFSFLMELDSNAGTDYHITVDSQDVTIKEPEYLASDLDTDYNSEVDSAIQRFVRSKYTELYNALNNNSLSFDELDAVIDVNSLAKYFLLNEIAKNFDIGVSSTYFVYKYDPTQQTGKFYISPVWDMDVTTGNCDSKGDDYLSYEDNWTDHNSDYNRVMKLVYNNVHVQKSARSIWTADYYTTLTEALDRLGNSAVTAAAGSYENNFIKWTYPYGFQGKYIDNVQAKTSLYKASYDVSANKYSKSSSQTTYNEYNRENGQIQYVVDWLKSRAAWMTQKYNTYYVTGSFDSWSEKGRTMTNTQDGVNTLEIQLSAGTYEFKISSDGAADSYRSGSAYSISFSPEMSTNYTSDSKDKIKDLSINTELYNDKPQNNFKFTTSEDMTVYIIYDQKTNTVTLSDQNTVSTNPGVSLDGPTLTAPAEGDTVTLKASITTPAAKDDETFTGNYVFELYKNGVYFAKTTQSYDKGATFVADIGKRTTTFTVKAYPVDATNLVGTSPAVSYTVAGAADNKIYFDPSTIYVNNVQIWKSQMTTDSTVTAYIKKNGIDIKSFTMVVDTEDVHGFDKGVFVANIDDDILALLQDSGNTIAFTMVGKDGVTYATDNDAGKHNITINCDSSIQSGWIYNYSNSDGQDIWEEYNVEDYTVAYPHSDEITNYAEFKQYLLDRANPDSANYSKYANDRIVYFDNSASKWYNVFIYGWSEDGKTSALPQTNTGIQMKKLPYADIWYYEFPEGTDLTTQKFLFKDRSDAGFGSDYQQTVDLVGTDFKTDYIVNGNGDKVYLNFAGSIDTPSPIFVTNNFYKSTIQNDEYMAKGLKFRAFNTQWQEFGEVVSSDVQTKAVDVYFDLHSSDATDITLYHTSTSTKFTFPSEFVRLTQLPGSTIYHTSLMLPYTDNGIAFKFDKFVVNGNEYPMSSAVQPAYTCINTGEVWYEYTDGINTTSLINAQSEDDGISAQAELSGLDALYFTPGDTWAASSATFKLNYQKPDGSWDATSFVLVDGTTNVYKATLDSSVTYQKFQFLRFSSDGSSQWDCSAEFTSIDSGCNYYTKNSNWGSTWDPNGNDHNGDPHGTWSVYSGGQQTGKKFNSVGLIGIINGSGDWLDDSYELEYADGVWSITIDFTGGANEFKARVNDKWDISFGSDDLSDTDAGSNNIKTTLNGKYKISIPDGAENNTVLTITKIDGGEPLPTVDHCGVLAYNHSTATFDSTEGGQIDTAYVKLTNGYYQSDAIQTGYTTFDGDKYTVIYALASNGPRSSEGASTSYYSTTSNTGGSSYYFNGWTKDARSLVNTLEMTDAVSGTDVVNYLANWSEYQEVTYTFTYKYDAFDTSKRMEYTAEDGYLIEKTYVLKINLLETATPTDVIQAYLSNAPKLQSDYFVYSFDSDKVDVVQNDTYTATSKADIAEVRQYSVTLDNDFDSKSYYYQNVASYSHTPVEAGKVTVWRNADDNTILGVGSTYKFRVTKNITIKYTEEDSSTIAPFTHVNEATYEFYTSGATEKVRFNFQVDNYGTTGATEYGVLYFFTDINGKPEDSTISYDVDVDEAKLVAAALNSSTGGVGSIKARKITNYNSDYKYIFAASITNNDTNKDRYLRVYSYFIDKDGNVVLGNYELASIRTALQQA